MVGATPRRAPSLPKRSPVNDIQLFQFWKLSHRMRRCFIRDHIERNETV